jgi:hypothetical protein
MSRHYTINAEGLDETDKSMLRNLRASGALVEAKRPAPTLDDMRAALRDMNANDDEPRVGLILTDEDEGFQWIEDSNGNRAKTNLQKSGWWYAVYL